MKLDCLRRTALLIAAIVAPFFLTTPLATAQSRMPEDPDNWLQVVGQTGLGSQSTANVAFFEVPVDTPASTLYFAVRDPGLTGDGPNTGGGETDHYLVGGAGALTDPASRRRDYPDAASAAQALVGTPLGLLTGADGPGWVYFPGVSPSQGERIGNRYYFKVVTVAENGTNQKNAYQIDVSTSSAGAPTGLTGVRSFAYSWTINVSRSPDDATDAREWNFYPFVPDGDEGPGDQYLVASNYDFDESQLGGSGTTSGEFFNTADASEGPVAISENDEYADTSVLLSAGQTGATWRTQYLGENSAGGALGVLVGQLWHWRSDTPENGRGGNAPDVNDALYRTYASFYEPQPPDRVAVSVQDDTVKANVTATGRVVFQLIDGDGAPVPFRRNIFVMLTPDDTARIEEASNTTEALPASHVLLTTDADGLAWVDISNSSVETVEITPVTDGTNGSDDLANTLPNESGSIDFVALLPPTIRSEANLVFTEGAGAALPDIVIESPEAGSISDEGIERELQIRVPAGLDAAFAGIAPGDLSVDISGGGGSAVVGTPAYSLVGGRRRIFNINVTGDFDAGQTVTVSGLELAADNSASTGRLELYQGDGGGDARVATDERVIIIEPAAGEGKSWVGGTAGSETVWAEADNWSPAGVPTAIDNVTILSSAANMPVIGAATSALTRDLSVQSGASLTIEGTLEIDGVLRNEGQIVAEGGVGVLTISSTLFNPGTLNVTGGGTVRAGGNWTNSGTFNAGNGRVLFDGPADQTVISGGEEFFDLEVDKAGGSLLLGDTTLAGGDVRLSGGTLDTADSDLTVTGSVTGAGTLRTSAGGAIESIRIGADFLPGTFEANDSPVLFVSGEPAAVGAYTYAELTVDKPGGTIVFGATTADTLTVTSAGDEIRFDDGLTVALGMTTAGEAYDLSIAGPESDIAAATTFLNTGVVTLGSDPSDVVRFRGGALTAGSATNPALTRLHGEVRSDAAPLSFGVSEIAGDTRIDTTNAGAEAAGADIAFAGTVDSASAGEFSLSLNAGTGGLVSFGGAVGGAGEPDSLTVESGVGGAEPLDIRVSGLLRFEAPVTLSASATLELRAGSLELADGASLATSDEDILFEINGLSLGVGVSVDAGSAPFTQRPRTTTLTVELGPVDSALATDVYYDSAFDSVEAGAYTVGGPAHEGSIFLTGTAAIPFLAPYDLLVETGGTADIELHAERYESLAAALRLNAGGTVRFGDGEPAAAVEIDLGSGTFEIFSGGELAGDLIAGAAGGITLSGALVGSTNNLTLLPGAGDATISGAASGIAVLAIHDGDPGATGTVTFDGLLEAETLTLNSGTLRTASDVRVGTVAGAGFRVGPGGNLTVGENASLVAGGAGDPDVDAVIEGGTVSVSGTAAFAGFDLGAAGVLDLVLEGSRLELYGSANFQASPAGSENAAIAFLGGAARTLSTGAGVELPVVEVGEGVSGPTVNLTSEIVVLGDIRLRSGVLDAGAGGETLFIGGSWRNEAGPAAFEARSGAVVLFANSADTDGAGNEWVDIEGSTRFHDFIAIRVDAPTPEAGEPAQSSVLFDAAEDAGGTRRELPAGVNLRFESNVRQYIADGGNLYIRGAQKPGDAEPDTAIDTGAGIDAEPTEQWIMLDSDSRDTRDPANPSPDSSDFWILEVEGDGSVLLMRRALVVWSEADPPLIVPGDVAVVGELVRGWLAALFIDATTTLDRRGNGRIDTIVVTVSPNLAHNFDGDGTLPPFEVEVDGYALDSPAFGGPRGGPAEVAGDNLDVAQNQFYIRLVEGDELDTDARPRWRISGDPVHSLVDSSTGLQSVTVPGPPDAPPELEIDPVGDGTYWAVPADRANPVIAHTLALPGRREIFMRFSEPVGVGGATGITAPIAAGNVADLQALGALPVAQATSTLIISGSGDSSLEVLLEFDSAVGLERILEQEDVAFDPASFGAGEAVVDAAGNALLDPGADPLENPPGLSAVIFDPALLSDRSRQRVSDLVLAPEGSAVVQPVFVADEVLRAGDPGGANDPSGANGPGGAGDSSGAGISLVRDFTGRGGYVEPGRLRMQVRIEQALLDLIAGEGDYELPHLFYSSRIPGRFTTSDNFWLPDHDERAFSALVPRPFGDFSVGTATAAGGSASLLEYELTEGDPEVAEGRTLRFLFRVGPPPPSAGDPPHSARDAGATPRPALYFARIGRPAGSDWYRSVRSWEFSVDSALTGRGGVTVMNNIIDPTAGQAATIRYELDRGGLVTINIFNLAGDLVDVVHRGRRSPGVHQTSWDGRNSRGTIVARGLYFVRVVGPGFDEYRKIMVVK